MTIFGTRPEIIRLSHLMKILDQYSEQITVHTGQNFDESLSDIFLKELDVKPPPRGVGAECELLSFGISNSSRRQLQRRSISTPL